VLTSQISSASCRAEQVDLALVGVRQGAAVAHARHLRAALFAGAGRAGNVMQVFRLRRIGHIDDGGAVEFLLPPLRVNGLAAMMADVGDPAFALPVGW
jgi:hypothetical protein